MNKYNTNDRSLSPPTKETLHSPSSSSDEDPVILTPTGKHRVVDRSANKLHPPILSSSLSRKNYSEGKVQKEFTDIFNDEKEKTIDCQVPPFLASPNKGEQRDVYTSLHPFVLNKKNKINATQSLSSDSLNASRFHQPLQQAQFLTNNINGNNININKSNEMNISQKDGNVLSRHNSIDLSKPHFNNLINLSPEKRAEIAPFNYSGSIEHFSLDTYRNEEKLEEIAPFHYSSTSNNNNRLNRNEKSDPSPSLSPTSYNNNNSLPHIYKKSNSLTTTNNYNISEEDRKIIAPFNDPNYVKPRTTSIDCDKNTLKQIAPFNDPEYLSKKNKSKSTIPLVYTNKDRNIIAPFNDPQFKLQKNTSLTMLSSVDKEKMKEIAPFNDPNVMSKKNNDKFKLECKEEDRIKIAPFIECVSPLNNNIQRKSPSKKSLAEISASPIIVSQQQPINISPEMREIIAPFSSPKNNTLPPPFELEKYYNNDVEKLDEIAPFRSISTTTINNNNNNNKMTEMKISTSQDILLNNNNFHSPISESIYNNNNNNNILPPTANNNTTTTGIGRKNNNNLLLPPLTPVNDNNNNNNENFNDYESKDNYNNNDIDDENNNDNLEYNLNKMSNNASIIGPQRFTSRSPGHVTSSEITIDAGSNLSVSPNQHDSSSFLFSPNANLKMSYNKPPSKLPPLEPL